MKRVIRIQRSYPATRRKIDGKYYSLVGSREKRRLALRFAKELRRHHNSVRVIKYKRRYWIYVYR